MKKKFWVGSAVGVMMFLCINNASANQINFITNGDFTSSLNGWTVDATHGHAQPAGLTTYDIDGTGSLPSSSVFYTQTGGGSSWDGKKAYVTLTQDVSLIKGDTYTFESFLSSRNPYWYGYNVSGGSFKVTIGTAVVGYYNFGSINNQSYEYYKLSGSYTSLESGLTTLSIYITRNDYSNSWRNLMSPYQYIDNISLMGDDHSAAPVPEPATMLLMGTGLAGLVGARRKKKK